MSLFALEFGCGIFYTFGSLAPERIWTAGGLVLYLGGGGGEGVGGVVLGA